MRYEKHLKWLSCRDKSDEDIAVKFRESGFWLRRRLERGGKVMVNCWQGGSRSATVVLAFLLQHEQLSLNTALVTLKQRRDIRPNNGFLSQLITLEETLLHGINRNLICLETKAGRDILNLSTEERLNDYEVMKKYFGKQSHNTFCGVQSCCITLNTMLNADKYNEASFWSIENVRTVLDESVVSKSGMTLEECRDLLNSFKTVTAVSYKTTDTDLDNFREQVVRAFSSGCKVWLWHAVIWDTRSDDKTLTDCCRWSSTTTWRCWASWRVCQATSVLWAATAGPRTGSSSWMSGGRPGLAGSSYRTSGSPWTLWTPPARRRWDWTDWVVLW